MLVFLSGNMLNKIDNEDPWSAQNTHFCPDMEGTKGISLLFIEEMLIKTGDIH